MRDSSWILTYYSSKWNPGVIQSITRSYCSWSYYQLQPFLILSKIREWKLFHQLISHFNCKIPLRNSDQNTTFGLLSLHLLLGGPSWGQLPILTQWGSSLQCSRVSSEDKKRSSKRRKSTGSLLSSWRSKIWREQFGKHKPVYTKHAPWERREEWSLKGHESPGWVEVRSGHFSY